jgi:UrcA family protein
MARGANVRADCTPISRCRSTVQITPCHQEVPVSTKIHSYTKVALSTLAAAAAACAVFAGNAAPQGRAIIDSIQVSTRGLDLARPADVQTFYQSLENAAWVLCTRGTRVALEDVDDFKGCYGKTLGEAVRSANLPMLTLTYLQTHTVQEATARGIKVPSQLAAK